MMKAAMNPGTVLRFLYALLFLCFIGMTMVQPVAQSISASFGFWPMIEALAGYAAFTAGLVWLTNRIGRDYYRIEPEPTRTPARMSETSLILNYMRQDQQPQKSVPYEFSQEPAKPSDPKD